LISGRVPFACTRCCSGSNGDSGDGSPDGSDGFEYSADRLIDAISELIDHPERRGAKDGLKRAFTATLIAVADEVEESLEDTEDDINDDMKEIKGDIGDIEDRLEGCRCANF